MYNGKEGRTKVHEGGWFKEDSMSLGLFGEDVRCRSKQSVGVKQIADVEVNLSTFHLWQLYKIKHVGLRLYSEDFHNAKHRFWQLIV